MKITYTGVTPVCEVCDFACNRENIEGPEQIEAVYTCPKCERVYHGYFAGKKDGKKFNRFVVTAISYFPKA